MHQDTIEAVAIDTTPSFSSILSQARKQTLVTSQREQEKLAKARAQTAQRIWNLRKKASIEARTRGYNEGKKTAISEVLVNQKSYQESIKDAETDILYLTLNIAKQVIGEEIKHNTSALIKRIKYALGQLLEHRNLKIDVHPGSLLKVKEELAKIEHFPLHEMRENSSLGHGDLAIQTSSGSISLKWEDHFEQIVQALKYSLSNRQSKDD